MRYSKLSLARQERRGGAPFRITNQGCCDRQNPLTIRSIPITTERFLVGFWVFLPTHQILYQPCLGARPALTAAARRRGGIRPGRGDVAEAVTAAVARSGTPAPAKGAFTAEKSPLLPAGWLSVAGVILRLGHSTCVTHSRCSRWRIKL